jgi:hypothetical protein
MKIDLKECVNKRGERARFRHDEHYTEKECGDQKRYQPELLPARKKTPKLG